MTTVAVTVFRLLVVKLHVPIAFITITATKWTMWEKHPK